MPEERKTMSVQIDGETYSWDAIGLAEGDPVEMRLGFKFGRAGSYSTMEVSLNAIGRHRPGDLEHREEVIERDMAALLRAYERVTPLLNTARGSINMSRDWSPFGSVEPPASVPDVPPPVAGTFAPPPPLKIPAPPATVTPPIAPPPTWPARG